MAGSREGIDALLTAHRRPTFNDIDHKESFCDEPPFYRTKVKLKKEIVTLGVPGIDPNDTVGTYVEPENWNDVISDPEVLVSILAMTEVAIGSFEGAVDPKTTTSASFPSTCANTTTRSSIRVAMFCTGGIRCEKPPASC